MTKHNVIEEEAIEVKKTLLDLTPRTIVSTRRQFLLQGTGASDDEQDEENKT